MGRRVGNNVGYTYRIIDHKSKSLKLFYNNPNLPYKSGETINRKEAECAPSHPLFSLPTVKLSHVTSPPTLTQHVDALQDGPLFLVELETVPHYGDVLASHNVGYKPDTLQPLHT